MDTGDEDTAADEASTAPDPLVARWAEAATVDDILLPLLDDESPYVRCTAATYLLRYGMAERAVAVLEEIAGDDALGAAASTADTALSSWKSRQEDYAEAT
ncbi:HEAT repeat domain-containing protein [Amycolatopsis anabasis]|uniref:HEAT repeat domain-containing protein n=1 Tax=Amycolatopsis anabasis TaxID=1840409 RepID=UPI00131A6E81|nr:HEAT repeat domain-containing protein [Amycolatopsis anabasis]